MNGLLADLRQESPVDSMGELTFTLVIMLASVFSARRTSSVDPIDSLRAD